MPQYELLDPAKHGKLRLRSLSEDDHHFARIVPGEFPMAAASCPIMLTKDPQTGAFLTIAILSLKPGEPPAKRIYERGGFKPLSLQCYGFYISGERIVIDRDNPRFSETEGEPLFTESLQPDDCLRQIQVGLGKLHAGDEAIKVFVESLMELKLIEPIDMSLKFDGGEQLTFKGLYTVALDVLREIEDAAAVRLFHAGHLELAYIMAASRKQFEVLAHLRNQKLNHSS